MTDRTDDFRLIAAALPPQPRRASPHPPKPKRPAPAGGGAAGGGGGAGVAQQVSTLGEFHSAASSIAKSIHQVSQKLEHLTKLVQQRGLFNDPGAEINSLVHVIKQEMQDLNAELDASQTYVNRRKKEMGDRNQAANHSVNVVGQLKTELINTAKTFKNVLQQRSNNLKAQKDHREMFVSSQSSTLALAPPPAYRPLGVSPSPWKVNGTRAGTAGTAFREGSTEECLPFRNCAILINTVRQFRFCRGQVTSYPEAEQDATGSSPLVRVVDCAGQLLRATISYLESRSSAVQEVEGHIAELGLIFNKLATMLQDQREMRADDRQSLDDTIHDNVEDAGESVNQGHMALLNTMRSLSSNRRVVLTVSGILLLFMLFFFVFLL
ncbi:unnamed protein product [Scytosiphon promiscuus]